MEQLMRVECDPSCGFMVQSHSEKEILGYAKDHAKKIHKMKKVSTADVKSMIKTV